MQLNTRITVISIFILICLPIAGIFYYRYSRPKPKPIQPRPEINITIIPGWNLRQIAEDWVAKGIVQDEEELFEIVGEPAKNYKIRGDLAPTILFATTSTFDYFFKNKPKSVSFEGYIFPDTYRVYADAKPEDVLKKIFVNLDAKITTEMREEVSRQGKSFFEILTMASIIEKEAPNAENMGIVSDIFWRRHAKNWALQSCATVNYITGKSDPGISAKDREIDSSFNTYKYPGLPVGPISNPSITAIKAAIYPLKNDYWYFMSDREGVTHYSKTLEEHNAKVYKYIK
jgi:UPF0755 protein